MASNTGTSVTVKNKDTLKKNVVNINTYMAKIAEELKLLSNNLNTLMKGKDGVAYWDGDDAVRFYNIAVSNLKNDIADYVTARNELEVLGRIYELVNAGYKK